MQRAGPDFDEQAGRWPEVGGIVARQPWGGIERLIPAGAGETAARRTRLRRFVELLLQWNRRVSNLISKNDESRVVEAHLAPSIEPAEWIASHGLSKWLDLGSGGGFPALPLALCGVGERWDLVESRRTKTLFLKRAVEQLELRGIRVITDRLEGLVGSVAAADPFKNSEALSPPYDGFTSRATMALSPTLALASHVVRPGGIAFLWKGSRLEEELGKASGIGSDWDLVERRKLSNGMTEVVKLMRRG